ncbi:Hypothetical predicted protein, partial [Olea europaea subsp. europaea]
HRKIRIDPRQAATKTPPWSLTTAPTPNLLSLAPASVFSFSPFPARPFCLPLSTI